MKRAKHETVNAVRHVKRAFRCIRSVKATRGGVFTGERSIAIAVPFDWTIFAGVILRHLAGVR